MKKVTGVLLLLLCVATTIYGQTSTPKPNNTDSTSTISVKPKAPQQEATRIKIGAGILFLRNPVINEALQTQSFLTPNIGLEIIGKRVGVNIAIGGFNANSTLDTTVYNANKGSLTQFFVDLDLLQILPINNQVSFRGIIGLGYLANNTSGFDSGEESGLSLNVSAGLEFHTTSSFSYFVELGYRHYRLEELGQLGGITLNFGVVIGSIPK